MKIFADEFVSIAKRILICSWMGHKKGGWGKVYWAVAHSAGYKAKYCKFCHQQLETTKKPKYMKAVFKD